MDFGGTMTYYIKVHSGAHADAPVDYDFWHLGAEDYGLLIDSGPE